MDNKEQFRLRKKSEFSKSACLERMKQQSSHKLELFAGEDQIFSMATHRPLTFVSLTTHVIAIKWLAQFGDKCPPLVLDDDIMIDPTLIPLPVSPSAKSSSPLLGRRNRLVRKKSEPGNMLVVPLTHKSESDLRSTAARCMSASDGLIRTRTIATSVSLIDNRGAGSSSDNDDRDPSDTGEDSANAMSYCKQLESSPERSRMRNEFRELLEKAQNPGQDAIREPAAASS
jgi:hypothetical protein